MKNISITSGEQAQRAVAVVTNQSDAPIKFAPLPPDGPEFTWAGHAANYGAGRRYGITVRCGIFHTTESESSIEGALRYDARRSERVSTSAFAGPFGELGVDVPEDNRPWTTGRWNDESVSLEVVGKAAWTAAQWRARKAQMEAIVQWTVGVCQRHKLPPTWLTAEQFAQGASLASQSPLRAGKRLGFTDHRTANNAAIALGHDPIKYGHHDVGTGLRTVINEDILPEAARRLGINPERPTVMNFNLLEGGSQLLLPDAAPVRIADSRTGLTLPLGIVQPGVVRIPIPHPGQPVPKSAVVNVTTTGATGPGYAKVWGIKSGDGSNANWVVGQTPDPSPTIALVGGMETIAIEVVGSPVHLIVDLLAIIC